MIAAYVAIGVMVVCLIALVSRTLVQPKPRVGCPESTTSEERSCPNELFAEFLRNSGGPNLSGSVEDTHQITRAGPGVAMLEAHLRNAILDPGARNRLINEATKGTRGDRAAAIQKVLNDLHAENNRWS